MPREWVYLRRDVKSGEERLIRKTTFLKYEPNRRTDDELTFAQYNLPDPVGYEPPPRRLTWLWVLLGVAALLAVVAWRLRGRAVRPTPSGASDA